MQLPDGWKNLKLEEIACLKAGKFIPASQIKPQLDEVCIYPCFGGNGIRGYVPENSHKGLFPIIGRQGALCGNVNLATGRFYATEHAIVATSRNNNDSLWLYYALQYAHLNQYATGQAQPGLSVDTINKIVFLVPPLAEQKKIAETLSVWDSAIEKMEKLVEKKEEERKINIWNLIANDNTKKVEIGRVSINKNQWNHKLVGHVLKIGHGKDYKSLSVGNVPVYGTGGYMTSVNEYLYDGETVCIGRKGTIDKPFYYCGKIWTVDTLFYTYDFENVLPKYIYYMFCTVPWKKFSEASGVPSLTSKIIENIEFNCPPLSEQQTIADLLSNFDKELSLLKQQLALYKKQKQGLMQKFLTGEWRVK